MKNLSKKDATIITTFAILLLVMVSGVLCKQSISQYKTRITVDTINLEIIPYQPVNVVDEELSVEDEQENNSFN